MPGLKDKFHGCIAASWIGSAMGAAVEGWSREKIRRTYGYLDSFQPYTYYSHLKTPGQTEDGIERQKLIATAIIEKRDRILAHDLVNVWLRDLDPERVNYKQEPFDKSLLEMARAGVPPVELGRLWPFPVVVSMGRASQPIGLINAGDPVGAAEDTFEVGKVYANETAFALRWAALVNGSIAAACRPDATVESVLQTARSLVTYRAQAGSLFARYDTTEKEFSRALELANKHSDPMELRDDFYRHYESTDFYNYHQSQANEVISKGFAIFAFHKGDVRKTILTAVNFGRDTDCLAAVAGGLAGALSGTEGIPADWIAIVDEATRNDPYTHNKRTIGETADRLYEAFAEKQARLSDYVELMKGQ